MIVAVIGHDDVETAQYFNPSLSTIRVPKYTLGAESAECLIKMIQHEHPDLNTQIVYEPELIVRGIFDIKGGGGERKK